MKQGRFCLSFGLAVLFLSLWSVSPALAASGEELIGPSLEDQQRPEQMVSKAHPAFVVGPEDVLEVVIRDNPQVSRQVVVRADGKITLPIIGEVEVQNRTPEEVKEFVREKALQYLREPIFVTVIVIASRNARVYLMGGGVGGNILPLTRPTTLLQLLAQANLSEEADLKNSFLLRASQKIPIDFEALVKRGALEQNIRLEPDDLVFVPLTDSFDGRIKVVGEVGHPQIIPYREGITVLDAILMAGGPTPFASQNGTKIVRINGSGNKTEVHVKLKNILKGDLTKNILLEPNDTIVVPQSLF